MSRLGRFVAVCVCAAAVVSSTASTASASPPTRLTSTPTTVVKPINIGTVPVAVGFPVTLDGVTRLTDSKGVAHFGVASTSALSSRVVLHDQVTTRNGRQVLLSAQRLYGVNDSPRLTLNISYRASFTFASSNGQPIDAKQIKTLTLKSVTGLVEKVPAHEASWLQGSRVVPLPGGLQVKNLYWTVQDVQYGGSNVVNASQQRFEPALNQTIPVKLLFYGVKVHVYDAFFGRSLGRSIDVGYPDGTVSRVALDHHGRVELPALPRGDYTFTTIGPGPTMSRPIAISREQVVDLKFYSWVDIFVFLDLMLIFVVGVLWWGRVRRRRPDDRTDNATVPSPSPSPEHARPEIATSPTGS